MGAQTVLTINKESETNSYAIKTEWVKLDVYSTKSVQVVNKMTAVLSSKSQIGQEMQSIQYNQLKELSPRAAES